MKFENTDVWGFEHAVRGARMPMMSHKKSDSIMTYASDIEEAGSFVDMVSDTYPCHKLDAANFLIANGVKRARNYVNGDDAIDTYRCDLIGYKDLDLLLRLLHAGDSDSKFLRMIHVGVDITAPMYWLAELDTYKVATTRNSSSLQHKGASRDFTEDDFTFDNYVSDDMKKTLIGEINDLRKKYKETKDYDYFRAMRQLIPESYNYTITFDCNYMTLRNMYRQRKNHLLKEWRVDFCDWVKSLPYSDLIINSGETLDVFKEASES